MNKNILWMGGLVFFFTAAVPHTGVAGEITPTNRITEVTVYPGSALIVRKADMSLPEGEHSVVFQDLKQDVDESTITVSGAGTAGVKIYGASLKKEYLAVVPDQRVQELKDAVETHEDRLVGEQRKQQVLQKEREFLQSVQLFADKQIPKDLVTTMPSVESLGNTLEFIRSRMTDVESREEEIRKNIRALQRDVERLKNELSQLGNQGQKLQHAIIVDLSCTKPGTLSLDVGYLVRGAEWWAQYDARADYTKGEVELTSYGVIKQTTGSDWDNVQMTLSTARPTRSGRMPYVAPWVLNPYQPQPRRAAKALSRREDMAGAPMLQMEAFDMAVNKEEEQPAEMALSTVEQKGVAFTYKMPRPVSLKSDGVESKFPVAVQVLKADYHYSAYPQAAPAAYLGSRVMNAKDQQLMAGPVNLFLDGEFVGKSGVDNIGPGEEFDLYLGVDDNVKVARQEIVKNVDDVLIAGIPSPNRKTQFDYKLTLENYKDKIVKVLLFEPMPVSQNDKIRVNIFNVSLKPQQKDWKDRAGVWLWEIELPPRGKKEILYSFTVEHPRDMQIPGL
ncbi:MAG: mucoidy inhibitor MuiA family protein [Candidatus Omnitrophota bacterium]|jgi:uncharacterized protein (TIGR02231 family)